MLWSVSAKIRFKLFVIITLFLVFNETSLLHASVTLSKTNITCCDYFDTVLTVKDPYGKEAENVAVKVYIVTNDGVKKDLSKYPYYTDKKGQVKILYKPMPGEALRIEIDEPWLSYSAIIPVKVPDKTKENLIFLVLGSVFALIFMFFLIKQLKLRYHINLLLTNIKKKMELMKKKKQEQQLGLGKSTEKGKITPTIAQPQNKAATAWVYTTKSVTKKPVAQAKPFGKK
ncbi:MAG: hypothetical protein N3E37_00725 [Candidatus Micrarchaeota archaeon]|nr:hypothetical protein [Candidatus Micrarchaeota archaeon]